MESPVPSHADVDANEPPLQQSDTVMSLTSGASRHGVNLARFDLVSLRLGRPVCRYGMANGPRFAGGRG